MGTSTALAVVIQQLIEIGQPKGHVTVKDLTNLLPADQITSEQLHAILGSLHEASIQVIDPCQANGVAVGFFEKDREI